MLFFSLVSMTKLLLLLPQDSFIIQIYRFIVINAILNWQPLRIIIAKHSQQGTILIKKRDKHVKQAIGKQVILNMWPFFFCMSVHFCFEAHRFN